MGWVELQAERLEKEPGGCDLANAAVELRDWYHPAYADARIQKLATRSAGHLVRRCWFHKTATAGRKPVLLLEGARVNRQASGPGGSSRRFKEACEATITAFERSSSLKG